MWQNNWPSVSQGSKTQLDQLDIEKVNISNNESSDTYKLA